MITQTKISGFIESLSSKDPTPGGGGACALIGAVSAALCSMVASLTSGKEKYGQYQGDIERIIESSRALSQRFLLLADRDAEAFAPLAKAYAIPKDDPARDAVLESALKTACGVPLDILSEIANSLDLADELLIKGTKLALSDVGVAAAAFRAAAQSAALNVYVNTKLMKDRRATDRLNIETAELTANIEKRCGAVYESVLSELGGKCV